MNNIKKIKGIQKNMSEIAEAQKCNGLRQSCCGSNGGLHRKRPDSVEREERHNRTS
jgi:hypothetical protein